MAGLALDVDRMLDYRETDEHVRGFTRVVARVKDVAHYVVPVRDFGRAVATFRFALPADLGVQQLGARFDEFAARSPIFEAYDADAVSDAEYDVLSLSRLGEDGYVGVYECGAGSTNKYMLVVQSYDACGAERFQLAQEARIRRYVDGARTPEERFARLEHVSPAKRTLDHRDYQSVLARADVNRRHIAACFFEAMGIPVQTELHALPEVRDKIVVTAASAVHREYPAVFLAREGTRFMRVYNWAYRYDDVLDGAPWHMCPHEGLRVYHGHETVKAPLRGRHVAGIAMGSPHARRTEGTRPPDEADAEIERVVRWSSGVSTVLVAAPALRMPTARAVAQLETDFSLSTLRVDHWRAVRVAIYPVAAAALRLRDRVMFGKAADVAVPYHALPEVMEMWATLVSFRANRARIAHSLPRAWDGMPDDYAVPALRTLFGREDGERAEATVERGILQTMYATHDEIMRTMAVLRDAPHGVVPAARGELTHEMILREVAAIPEPRDAAELDDAVQSGDDPIGASDVDTGTDMSDTDAQVLRASRAPASVRAAMRAVPLAQARPRAPAPRAPPQPVRAARPPDPEPVALMKFDAGAESDAYAELGISEDDNTR